MRGRTLQSAPSLLLKKNIRQIITFSISQTNRGSLFTLSWREMGRVLAYAYKGRVPGTGRQLHLVLGHIERSERQGRTSDKLLFPAEIRIKDIVSADYKDVFAIFTAESYKKSISMIIAKHLKCPIF